MNMHISRSKNITKQSVEFIHLYEKYTERDGTKHKICVSLMVSWNSYFLMRSAYKNVMYLKI